VLGLATCLGLALSDGQDRPRTELGDAAFQSGLAALHNFEYEQANEAFREARRADPSLVLAYWGEALTYYQTLWRNENLEAGRRALAALGSSPAARAAKARNPHEKALLGAVELLFGEGDADTRHRRYVDAMAKVAAENPDDPDVVSLYGLALLGTTSRSLIGFGDARNPGLAGSDLQKQVATLLNHVLSSHPRHPGALHYLLHAYDDPEHAPLALEAARAYASVAQGASHALHMPAHIFLQTGLWHDAASSDQAAYDASNEWVERRKLPLALRNYHALSWLQYELLQLGRYSAARATFHQIEPVVKDLGSTGSGAAQEENHAAHQPLLGDLSSMRARFVIEARRWDLMASANTFGNVNELFVIGVSAARTGNIPAARTVRERLADRTTAPEEGDMRPAIAIMERELAALIELAGGRTEEAVGLLETAAQAELSLPLPLGLPAPIKPAPELLGEVLLEVGRPRDAIPHFEAELRLHPNRSLSVLGLARAAAAAGETAIARQRYQELLTNYDRADDSLPEPAEARASLERLREPKRVENGPTATVVWSIAIIGTAAAAMLVLRGRLAKKRTRRKKA
jgi:tetratricopeptide (TPR) repeat protein